MRFIDCRAQCIACKLMPSPHLYVRSGPLLPMRRPRRWHTLNSFAGHLRRWLGEYRGAEFGGGELAIRQPLGPQRHSRRNAMLATNPAGNSPLLHSEGLGCALLGAEVLDESFNGCIHVLRAR